MKTTIATTLPGLYYTVDESPGQVDSRITTAGGPFVLLHQNGQELAININHIVSLEPYE